VTRERPAKIGVLIVDDSAIVRATLQHILAAEHDIEVIGVAADPFIAANKIRERTPDVIMLDIEMPRMDGLTFMRKIMTQHPIPIVVCSALTTSGAEATMRAMELGAVEIVAKPQVGTKRFLEESSARITDAVRGASQARLDLLGLSLAKPVEPKRSADAVIPRRSRTMLRTTDRVIALGASTGGTEAIRVVLSAMPADCPGLVIVQHMPPQFTTNFAARLNQLVTIEVKEAEDGDAVIYGRALIAPGDRHMLLTRSGARYHVQLLDGPLVSRHRPSVDVLFRSVAENAGPNAVGVLMTGMGDDGANGLLEMREAGARTVAQDEASSVVFGMPAVAIARGAAERVWPLSQIAESVVRLADAEHVDK
jgi:two-component system, chemotaxis family, protein-glutamate methylesterase/glutaminase